MYLKDKAIEIKTAQCFTPVSQAEIFLVNDTDFRSIRLLKDDSLSRTTAV